MRQSQPARAEPPHLLGAEKERKKESKEEKKIGWRREEERERGKKEKREEEERKGVANLFQELGHIVDASRDDEPNVVPGLVCGNLFKSVINPRKKKKERRKKKRKKKENGG